MGNTASIAAVAPFLGGSSILPHPHPHHPPHHLTLNSTIALPNGVAMPRLGFGVWQVAPQECTSVVETALASGYRHIDSAQAYRNEAEAGAALRHVDIPRADIWFTTKIPRDMGSVDANYESLVASVGRIHGVPEGETPGEDLYVDLFLIHTPRMGQEGIKNVWLALERLLAENRTRSIGVSNFGEEHIEGMREYAKVWPPHVNQIQLNPWVQERDTVKYCDDKGIVLQAYSPLATGRKLDDPTVVELAKKYRKSPAQVLIRYSLQKGWVPLPKSVHSDRIVENTQIYDFKIGHKDMHILDGLDGNSETEL